MDNPFTKHPQEVGETYWKHLRTALTFSVRLLGACLACTIHAFFPFLFKCTASQCIAKLHDKMIVNRKDRRP